MINAHMNHETALSFLSCSWMVVVVFQDKNKAVWLAMATGYQSFIGMVAAFKKERRMSPAGHFSLHACHDVQNRRSFLNPPASSHLLNFNQLAGSSLEMQASHYLKLYK